MYDKMLVVGAFGVGFVASSFLVKKKEEIDLEELEDFIADVDLKNKSEADELVCVTELYLSDKRYSKVISEKLREKKDSNKKVKEVTNLFTRNIKEFRTEMALLNEDEKEEVIMNILKEYKEII